ncbi:MAG: mechanosensitive ion channel family protein [Oscillospiraceae bacterium]
MNPLIFSHFKLQIASDIPDISEYVENGIVKASFFTKLWSNFLEYLPTLIVAIIVYVICSIINKIVMKILSKGLERSKIDTTVHGFLKSLVKVVLLCITIIIVLTILRVPMTSIIAVVGSAGIAIGLALQSSLSNIAGGVIVLVEKNFRVGDYISINGTEGKVKEISVFATNIISYDNKSVFVPNGVVSNATIINYTREKTRRVDHVMSISYNNDTKKAIAVITEVLKNNSKVLSAPEPFVKVCAFGASSIDISVRAWVNTSDYWDVYFDLLEEIKASFDENGIVIPYNQLDVHMINSENTL